MGQGRTPHPPNWLTPPHPTPNPPLHTQTPPTTLVPEWPTAGPALRPHLHHLTDCLRTCPPSPGPPRMTVPLAGCFPCCLAASGAHPHLPLRSALPCVALLAPLLYMQATGGWVGGGAVFGAMYLYLNMFNQQAAGWSHALRSEWPFIIVIIIINEQCTDGFGGRVLALIETRAGGAKPLPCQHPGTAGGTGRKDGYTHISGKRGLMSRVWSRVGCFCFQRKEYRLGPARVQFIYTKNILLHGIHQWNVGRGRPRGPKGTRSNSAAAKPHRIDPLYAC